MNLKNKIKNISSYSLTDIVCKLIYRLFKYDIRRYYIMSIDFRALPNSFSPDINIVPMLESDIDKLPRDYFGNTDHNFKRNALLSKDPLFKGFMCYDNKHDFIGYCWIMLKGSKYLLFNIKNTDSYLSEFYINKNSRGSGNGPSLLTGVCNVLKTYGVMQMSLAVRTTNISAQKCYIKSGFKFIGKRYMVVNKNQSKVFPHHKL